MWLLIRQSSSWLAGGDTAARTAVRDAGRWLGIALAAVVNLVDVPCVVLGGSYAELAPWLRDAIARELEQRVVSAAWSPVRITGATLGGAAAVRGAGALPIRGIIADPDSYSGA